MPEGTWVDTDVAKAGGIVVLTAATGSFGEIVRAAGRVEDILAARPAGGGEEGERFNKAHEAVTTAVKAAEQLRELIQEMAENIVNGATDTEASDQTAANIVNGAAVHDIPDFKF